MKPQNSVIRICVYLTFSVATINAQFDSNYDAVKNATQSLLHTAYGDVLASIIITNSDTENLLLELSPKSKFDNDKFTKEECEKRNGSLCHFPVAHYHDLGCKVLYEDDPCCPTRYNCSHLNNKDKCFVNHHEYEIGKKLNIILDANRCEENCVCVKTVDGFAYFNCTSRKELCPPPRSDCYYIHSLYECCPAEVCPEKLQDRPKCKLTDGREYLDGDYYVYEDKPDFACICMATNVSAAVNGYYNTTTNSRCGYQNRWFWSDLNASTAFYRNCAPVYHSQEQRFTGQKEIGHWRCPKDNDIMMTRPSNEQKSDANTCIFGKLKMYTGYFLNPTEVDGNCTWCACVVPPVLSCFWTKGELCNMYTHLESSISDLTI